MPNQTPEERFGKPESFAELQQRIAELGGDITEIMAQLSDRALSEKMGSGYQHWRSRAVRAKAAKIAEISYLKALRQEFDQERQAKARANRLERQAKAATREAELREADDWTSEEELIRSLYRALMRLYRLTGEMPSEKDFDIIARTSIYLKDHDINI